MANYLKKNVEEPRDYRNRFEFILTSSNAAGQDIIICQRYFKIDNFNQACLMSTRLSDAVIRCAKMINKDLTEKSVIYTEAVAPRVFSTVAEMEDYFKNPDHHKGMIPGEGIVIREASAPNYVYHKDGPKESPTKFNKTEFSHELTEEDEVSLKLTIIDHATFKYVEDEPKVDPRTGEKEKTFNYCNTVFREVVDNEIGNKKGRVICSYAWTNILPKIVKNLIDLSNKKMVTNEKESLTLSGDESILNKMTAGRPDLVNKIIRELCYACSNTSDWWYKKAYKYGEEHFI